MNIITKEDRQLAFNKKIQSHLNGTTLDDGGLGLTDFSLYQFINPSSEYLDYIKPGLSKGYYNTSLEVFYIKDLQFKFPYDKYQMMFRVGDSYIEYNKYCVDNNIEIIFADDSIFFVTAKDFVMPISGTLLISGNGGFVLSNTASVGSIPLKDDLYLTSDMSYIYVEDLSTIYNIKKLDENLSISETLSTNSIIVSCEDDNTLLSSTILAVYDVGGVPSYNIFDANYTIWNHNVAVIDMEYINRISPNIHAMYIFTVDLDDVSEYSKLKPSELYTTYMDFLKSKSIDDNSLIPFTNDDNVSLNYYSDLPIINYMKDDLYFENLRGISRNTTRTLMNDEYTPIHYNVKEYTVDGSNIKLSIPNRYLQCVNIYINGEFYHNDIIRNDSLGLSHITIQENIFETFAPVESFEVIVEPMFTKRYDLVKDEIIMYGLASGDNIENHKNFIPFEGSIALAKSLHLFINGNFIHNTYYSIADFSGNKFIVVNKDIIDNISNVSVVINYSDIYTEQKLSSVNIKEYSILDEHCKLYHKGKLVPLEYLVDLLDGKYVDVELNDFVEEAILYQKKDNPEWEYIKDAVTTSLIKGFISIEGNNINFIDTEALFNYLSKDPTDNIMMTNKYPLSSYEESILKHSKFVYDIYSIGKVEPIMDANGILGAGSVSKVIAEYPENMTSSGAIIIDTNKIATPQDTVNGNYDRYIP